LELGRGGLKKNKTLYIEMRYKKKPGRRSLIDVLEILKKIFGVN